MAAAWSSVALLVLVPAAAAAQGGSVRTVTVYDGHATIEIPSDWNEIPTEVLEFYSLRSAEETGGIVNEVYQYGFRPGDPEADFRPPQVLIQIRESGRIRFGELLHLPEETVIRGLAKRESADVAGPYIEDSRLGEVRFDRESFSLRVSNTLDLTIEGEVIVESASFLTERGTFTVHCYALLKQRLDLVATFDRIIDSVRFDDAVRYRPRFTDRIPRRSPQLMYAIAAALALAILVVHLVQRRRRST